MKRYELNRYAYAGHPVEYEMDEDPEGDWVKYEDIKHLLGASKTFRLDYHTKSDEVLFQRKLLKEEE